MQSPTPLAFLAALAPTLQAQGFEDPGVHLAGWRDVTFPSATLTLPGRVYYPATAAGQDTPADPSQGPYPVTGLLHGQSFEPKDYDALSLHLASWGYVVASIGPLGGGLHAPPSAGKRMAHMLQWVDAQSLDPASFLFAMASADDWSAMGHSLGGAGMQYLIAAEPRVRAIIALQPFFASSGTPVQNLIDFDGAVLSIGGEIDSIVPPALHAIPFFDAAKPLGRSSFAQIQGTSHYGVLDAWPPFVLDPLPYSEQHRMHRKLVTAFLEAQIRGDEDAYVALLGEGLLGEPIARESGSREPPLWALASVTSPGDLVVGVAGRPLDDAFLALSPFPASIPTAFGTIGVDPSVLLVFFAGQLNNEGWTEVLVPIPPGISGATVYVQGVVIHPPLDALLSRTDALVVP